MITKRSRSAKFALFVLLLGALASCALPRSGPNKREIFSGSVQRSGDAFVVAVNDRVTRMTAVAPALGFSEGFLTADILGSDTINPGDTLGLQIWENVDTGLLSTPQTGGTAVLEQVQVDGTGFIFVPYAGRIQAAGNTPEAVRGLITERLARQTPDPQVAVRRVAGDGATVSILGGVGGQGIYPIERPSRTLTSMLALAGGVAIDPEIAQVTVTRGNVQGQIWLEDLFRNPALDIPLRGGDRIFVEEDTRAFVALGATGSQNRVPFDTQSISAVEAIARVGGLNPNLADPTGVFIFRNEPQEIANSLLGREDLIGAQRLIYVLDLTEPNGVFLARDFSIRDDDTVYVTEAPYSQFNKVLQSVAGPLQTVNAIDTIVNFNP